MSGGFAFGGSNSGGQQFRSVMPGIPSMQTSPKPIAKTNTVMDPRMADDDFNHGQFGQGMGQQGQRPLTGNFQPSFMNQSPMSQGAAPLTGNFQPSFGTQSQNLFNQYQSAMPQQGQHPLTGNFQPSFMNQGQQPMQQPMQQPTPGNRPIQLPGINYGPQAVNEPTSQPQPYSPPPHSPLTGNFQPRFPSTITRGYR